MFRAIENAVPFLPDRQTALRHGPRHPAADARDDRPRSRHVRLRHAHPRAPATAPPSPSTARSTSRTRDSSATRRPLCETAHPHVAGFSRAYLRHLFRAGEILALRLLSFHNLHFYLRLVRRARQAVEAGNFPEFRETFLRRYQDNDNP